MIRARFLLDTNILIYVRRQRPAIVVERLQSAGPGSAVVSAITYGELRYGAEKGRDRRRDVEVLDGLIQRLPVQAIPPAAGEAYGSIRAHLERRGQLIGTNDLWIAAHALAAGLTLVTNNEREFRRVPGLAVENWAA